MDVLTLIGYTLAGMLLAMVAAWLLLSINDRDGEDERSR